jgi:hypothetical protein
MFPPRNELQRHRPETILLSFPVAAGPIDLPDGVSGILVTKLWQSWLRSPPSGLNLAVGLEMIAELLDLAVAIRWR